MIHRQLIREILFTPGTWMKHAQNWLVAAGRTYSHVPENRGIPDFAQPLIIGPEGAILVSESSQYQQLASNVLRGTFIRDLPKSERNKSMKPDRLHFAFLSSLLLLSMSFPCAAQTCFSSDDMSPAARSALQATGMRYFGMVAHGDAASLKQNSIPDVANNFTAIENTIKDNQEALAGATATPRPPFMLKAEGTAPIPKADFLCGVFGSTGQTKDSAEFTIPNLPPGTYGIVILDAPAQTTAFTISFILEQQGTDWKVAGFYVRPAQTAGHDSSWFLDRARGFKAKGQNHNAWLYFIEGRELAMPLPFMYTQATDKLYDEAQAVKPTDWPVDGSTADLASPDGKTYKLTTIFPYSVNQDLDVVVKYQVPSVADTGQTFQENVNVMHGLLTKFPELRDAFASVIARAVQPDGKDYGSLLPMKDVK